MVDEKYVVTLTQDYYFIVSSNSELFISSKQQSFDQLKENLRNTLRNKKADNYVLLNHNSDEYRLAEEQMQDLESFLKI